MITALFNFVKRLDTIILIIISIVSAIIFKNIIAMDYKILAYTISYVIKSILIFLIPLLILPFIIQSIIEMKSRGASLICIILVMVFFSNIISLIIPYAIGIHIIPYLSITEALEIHPDEGIISSLYNFNLPEILSIPQTMVLGVSLGLTLGCIPSPFAIKIVKYYHNLSCKFFEKIFIRLLPIYIFGTMLKIIHEIDFIALLPIFGSMICLIVALQIIYISFLFFIVCGGNRRHTLVAIKNALPAGVVGFSTMSSLVTMPVTLKAAEENTQNSEVANVTISTTVNCHDVGGCISLPMIALTIYYITSLTFPDVTTYTWFVLLVAFAQFSSASVPGGSVAIILPFLTHTLGFTNEMASLVVALSICLDPIETANNVMGNSVFVIFINKIYNKILSSISLTKKPKEDDDVRRLKGNA